MPHVVIKMHSGRTEEQKQRLADEVTRAVMTALGSKEASVSVAIEDVEPARWMADVYEPEIAGRKQTLYKQPGY
jgi:4-oxalocrotonate tautomerase